MEAVGEGQGVLKAHAGLEGPSSPLAWCGLEAGAGRAEEGLPQDWRGGGILLSSCSVGGQDFPLGVLRAALPAKGPTAWLLLGQPGGSGTGSRAVGEGGFQPSWGAAGPAVNGGREAGLGAVSLLRPQGY